MPHFLDLVEQEFAYLTRLWAVAMSRHQRRQNESRHNHAIWVQHDAW